MIHISEEKCEPNYFIILIWEDLLICFYHPITFKTYRNFVVYFSQFEKQIQHLIYVFNFKSLFPPL